MCVCVCVCACACSCIYMCVYVMWVYMCVYVMWVYMCVYMMWVYMWRGYACGYMMCVCMMWVYICVCDVGIHVCIWCGYACVYVMWVYMCMCMHLCAKVVQPAYSSVVLLTPSLFSTCVPSHCRIYCCLNPCSSHCLDPCHEHFSHYIILAMLCVNVACTSNSSVRHGYLIARIVSVLWII